MDDVIFEEFKGTGNMELVLDRKMSEKRIFPAVDIAKSGTRRDDLLLDTREQEAAYFLRNSLIGSQSTTEITEQIIDLLYRTKTNKDFVEAVKQFDTK
jgi:transcription termination factor Rho